MRGTLQALAIGSAASILVGCQTGRVAYELDVRNNAAQPIDARLVRGTEAPGRALSVVRIGPADRGRMLITRIPKAWHVALEVDAQGNLGYPARMPLEPGRTAVNVQQDRDASRARLLLSKVQRGQGE